MMNQLDPEEPDYLIVPEVNHQPELPDEPVAPDEPLEPDES